MDAGIPKNIHCFQNKRPKKITSHFHNKPYSFFKPYFLGPKISAVFQLLRLFQDGRCYFHSKAGVSTFSLRSRNTALIFGQRKHQYNYWELILKFSSWKNLAFLRKFDFCSQSPCGMNFWIYVNNRKVRLTFF